MGLQDTGNEYVMDISQPSGLNQNDLKIDLTNDVLTVSGQHSDKKEEKDDKGGQRMFSSSMSFSRSVRLPKNVDQAKIDAQFTQDGRLHITLPKKDDGTRRRSIQIGGQQQKQIKDKDEKKMDQ